MDVTGPYRLVVESREVVGGTEAVLVATLNLVDLAGSERIFKSGAEGIRAKEGAHINKVGRGHLTPC